MLAPSNDVHFALDPDVPFRVLDGQAVVIDSRLRQVHLFNETGSRIWVLLKAPCSISAIAASLAAEYAAEPAELEPQVQAFIEALLALKLVVPQADG